MKIKFISEGGSIFGMGHITRCLSLFTAFSEHNIVGEFIVHGDVVLKEPHKLYDWNTDIKQLHQDIAGADVVILDSLHASSHVIKELTSSSCLPVFIDDFRRLSYDRGVIIDWTPFVEKTDRANHNSQCSYLLGCEYISLRKSFWDIPEKNIHDNVSEILITMGSGDIRGLCPKILSLLLENTSPTILKTVVVGDKFSNENVGKLKAIASQNPCVQLVHHPDEGRMLKCFLKADIVISAGGQTLYELARVGAPTIAIMLIDNQQTDIDGWSKAGFIDYAGNWEDPTLDHKILVFLKNLMKNKEMRSVKSEIGRSFVDGKGTQRIVEHILHQLDKA